MKRLSLEELKAQKGENVKENLEAIKGGSLEACHTVSDGRDALIRVPGTHH